MHRCLHSKSKTENCNKLENAESLFSKTIKTNLIFYLFLIMYINNINELKIAAYVLKCTAEDVALKLAEYKKNSSSPKARSLKILSDLNSKLELYRQGFPLDYVLGHVEILDLKLKLNKNILIPRPETVEWLEAISKNTLHERVQPISSISNKSIDQLPPLKNVESLVSNNKILSLEDLHIKSSNINLLLDVGCGSGLIGLYLAKMFPEVVLTDYSKNVIKIAVQNAHDNQISNVKFFQSNLLSNFLLKNLISNQPYILVSNLPYVPTKDIEISEQNKIQHEPKKAIFSGEDGLDLFRKLIKQIGKNSSLKPAEIILELDPRNILEAQEILQKLYTQTSIYKDELGNLRLLHGWIDQTVDK